MFLRKPERKSEIIIEGMVRILERKYQKLDKSLGTGEEWNISITDFIKMFPDENLKESSMRSAVKYKKPYKGYLKITNLK